MFRKCIKPNRAGLLAMALSCLVLTSGPLLAQDSSISRFLLIKLSRDQFSVLCGSEKFTQCMGFSASACSALSEKAITQCLMPLPERIELEQLENETIENCPRLVFADAGFTDEKAQQCLDSSLQQD